MTGSEVSDGVSDRSTGDVSGRRSGCCGYRFVAECSHRGGCSPTTAVIAAAGDEVSAAIASLFSGHAQAYQALGAQAAAFHCEFTRALTAAGGAYAAAEAANASPMQAALRGGQCAHRGAGGAPADRQRRQRHDAGTATAGRAGSCSATAATAGPVRPGRPAATAATPGCSATAATAGPAVRAPRAARAVRTATAATAEPGGSVGPAARRPLRSWWGGRPRRRRWPGRERAETVRPAPTRPPRERPEAPGATAVTAAPAAPAVREAKGAQAA